MTEQHPAAPVAGPPAGGVSPQERPAAVPDEQSHDEPFADLEHRPVAEHVAVFETEHARLQQELSSIDQL
jgi:hypothetical protein